MSVSTVVATSECCWESVKRSGGDIRSTASTRLGRVTSPWVGSRGQVLHPGDLGPAVPLSDPALGASRLLRPVVLWRRGRQPGLASPDPAHLLERLASGRLPALSGSGFDGQASPRTCCGDGVGSLSLGKSICACWSADFTWERESVACRAQGGRREAGVTVLYLPAQWPWIRLPRHDSWWGHISRDGTPHRGHWETGKGLQQSRQWGILAPILAVHGAVSSDFSPVSPVHP